MASAAHFQADSSVSADLAGMVLLQKELSLIEDAVEDLELKTKGQVDLVTEDRTALREEAKTTTESFADRLVVMENKVNHLERFQTLSCSELQITEAFANDLGTLQYDVYQLKEVCIEIGREGDLLFTTVADRLGIVET